jgi:dipeptidase E
MQDKTMQIIAIGGGGFGGLARDAKLEQYIIKQSSQLNPRICFLAQASAEDKDYVAKFHQTVTALNAVPSDLSLFGRVNNDWKEHLLSQDIIYVGGGNTRSLLALWREWGVDEVLKTAYQNGIILAGVSAGAICWFEQCVTDSVWPLGVIPGLGFLEGSCCPHYDSEPERRPTFLEKLALEQVRPGLALEDNTAAHFVNGKIFRVIANKDQKKAYNVSKTGEELLSVTYLD